MHWYNGRLNLDDSIHLSINNPGLLYGATVFTTLRTHGQPLSHPLTLWSAHCDRLRHSIQILGWASPNWEQIQQGAIALSEHYPVLRITLFPNGQEWIIGRSLPPDLAQRQKDGITAWIAEPAESYGRSLPHLKTGNYLTAWQAKQEAQKQQAQEAILINADGHWLETSTGTLWGWGDGKWWTPPLSAGILPGVMRSHLITQLKCQNERIEDVPWKPTVIAQMEAIAYSNSVIGIIPIHTILSLQQPRSFNPKHPAIQALVAQFQETSIPDF